MKLGSPGTLCPRRGLLPGWWLPGRSLHRWPGLWSPVALLVVWMAFSPIVMALEAGSSERLSRVTYRWGGRDQVAVGAVTYEADERAALRLFDEKLSGYYTIYLAATELIEVEPLTRTEATAIRVDRAARQEAARLRRADVARERREARAATLREGARKRSERAASGSRRAASNGRSAAAKRSPSIDTSDISAVRRERARRTRVAQRDIDRVAEAIEPLGARLEAVVRAHNSNVSAVRSRIAGGAPPARVRAWVGQFESFSTELEKLSKHLDSRRGSVDRLRGSLASRSVRTREASEAADGILARLRGLEKRLARAEEDVQEHRAVIAELTDEDFAPVSTPVARTGPGSLTLASRRPGDDDHSAPSFSTTTASAAGDATTPASAHRTPLHIEHLTLPEDSSEQRELVPAVVEVPSPRPPAEARPPARVTAPTPQSPASATGTRPTSRSGLPRGVYLLLAGVILAAVIGALRRVRSDSGPAPQAIPNSERNLL